MSGSRTMLGEYRPPWTWGRRSAMRCGIGLACSCSSTTVGWRSVESTTGAVAVASRQVGGGAFVPPPQPGLAWLRFLSPLIEPDMRSYRIRLPPVPSDLRSRQVDTTSRHSVEAECLVKILVRDLGEPGACPSRSSHQPAAAPPFGIGSDKLVGWQDRSLVEVATPAPNHAADAGDRVRRLIRIPLARCPLMDSSEQALHRLPRRPGPDIRAPVFAVEATDRVAEEVE